MALVLLFQNIDKPLSSINDSTIITNLLFFENAQSRSPAIKTLWQPASLINLLISTKHFAVHCHQSYHAPDLSESSNLIEVGVHLGRKTCH